MFCAVEEKQGRTEFNSINVPPNRPNENRPFLKIFVGEKKLPVFLLVDSGAQKSILKASDFNKINSNRDEKERLILHPLAERDKNRFTSANGSGIGMKGWTNVKLNIQGRTITHPFLVADEVTSNMLGQDAILRLGLVIDGNKCSIKHSYTNNDEKIYVNSVEMGPNIPRKSNYCIMSKRDIEIAPGHAKTF